MTKYDVDPSYCPVASDERCAAVVRDVKNGRRYNLRRVLVVPRMRRCRNRAQPGRTFCKRHATEERQS